MLDRPRTVPASKDTLPVSTGFARADAHIAARVSRSWTSNFPAAPSIVKATRRFPYKGGSAGPGRAAPI